MASSANHLEKTFSELYRKEIDQEENMWRTLPFFVAAIALQFGLVSGLLTRLPYPSGIGSDVTVAIILMIVLDVATLIYLGRSVGESKFEYIPDEKELLKFSREADSYEREWHASGPSDQTEGYDAEVDLKRRLLGFYAQATSHNRRINQANADKRKIAGLLILLSMFLMLFLLGRVSLYLVG